MEKTPGQHVRPNLFISAKPDEERNGGAGPALVLRGGRGACQKGAGRGEDRKVSQREEID